jgi:hypothetical protein
MEAGLAEIKVCGLPCVLDAGNSDAAHVECLVPYVQSLASIDTFT